MNEAPSVDTRAELLARAQGYQSTEPSFARFLRADGRGHRPRGPRRSIRPTCWKRLFREVLRPAGQARARHATMSISCPPSSRATPRSSRCSRPTCRSSSTACWRRSGRRAASSASSRIRSCSSTRRPTACSRCRRPAAGSRASSTSTSIRCPTTCSARPCRARSTTMLTDVGRAVAGWRPMLERVQQAMARLARHAPKAPPAAGGRGHAFPRLAGRAQFHLPRHARVPARGARRRRRARLVPVDDSGLGILEDPERLFLRSGANYVEMTRAARARSSPSPEPLMVTKANIRSRVHRRATWIMSGSSSTTGGRPRRASCASSGSSPRCRWRRRTPTCR